MWEYNNEIPRCFGADYPDYYFSVPAQEGAEKIEINQDLCVVDEIHFFIRGRMEEQKLVLVVPQEHNHKLVAMKTNQFGFTTDINPAGMFLKAYRVVFTVSRFTGNVTS